MKKFKRILIPTDGSSYSNEAVQKGLTLAKQIGSEVTAIYVINRAQNTGIITIGHPDDLYISLSEEAKNALGFVRKYAEVIDLNVNTQILDGVPWEEIVKKSNDYDLIVMGTLGKTGITRIRLGSVAEKVTRHASCPVMIIRNGFAVNGRA